MFRYYFGLCCDIHWLYYFWKSPFYCCYNANFFLTSKSLKFWRIFFLYTLLVIFTESCLLVVLRVESDRGQKKIWQPSEPKIMDRPVIFEWNVVRTDPDPDQEDGRRRQIWCTQFLYLMLERLDHDDWRSDVWIWIAIHALWMSASGWESTSPGRWQQSSHICVLERNPEALVEHWVSFGRAAESSGRMQAGVVRSFSTQRKVRMGIHVVLTDDALVWCASGRYDTSSGWLVLWTAGRPDGMTHRRDG